MPKLELEITAKNRLAAGFASAGKSIKGIGSALKTAMSSSLGVMTAVIGAFMALQKAIQWVSKAVDRHNQRMAEIKTGNAANAVKRLADEYSRLRAAIDTAEKVTALDAKTSDDHVASTRKLADAQRDMAKAKELAALKPEDKAGAEAIEARYDGLRKEADAQRAVADAQTERGRAERAAVAKREHELALGTKALEIAKKSNELVALSEAYNAKALAAKTAGNRDFYTEQSKLAAEAAASLSEEAQKIAVEKRAAFNEVFALESAARYAAIKEQAAVTEANATALEIRTDAARKAAQESAELRAKEEEKAKQKLKTIAEDIADAERKASADKWQAEVDGINKAIAAREELAEKTVRSYIDEIRERRRAGKQWEMDQARAERLRGRGGQQAQDFVAAVDEIKRARSELPALQARATEANAQLTATQRTNATLEQLLTEQKAVNAKMQTLLTVG